MRRITYVSYFNYAEQAVLHSNLQKLRKKYAQTGTADELTRGTAKKRVTPRLVYSSRSYSNVQLE